MDISEELVRMGMREVINALEKYYENASETEKIIITSALSAAGADAISSVIPGLAIPATIFECFGAVWIMYGLLCKKLNISLKDNILRILARAALTNIAANLVGLIAALLAGLLIPGESVIAAAIVAFITVYLAGLIFLKLILQLVRKGYDPHTLSGVTQSELKKEIKEMKVSKDNLDDAKKAYEESKQ